MNKSVVEIKGVLWRRAAQEHDLLIPMIEGTRENFEAIGNKQGVFEKAKLTADSGFHTEAGRIDEKGDLFGL